MLVETFVTTGAKTTSFRERTEWLKTINVFGSCKAELQWCELMLMALTLPWLNVSCMPLSVYIKSGGLLQPDQYSVRSCFRFLAVLHSHDSIFLHFTSWIFFFSNSVTTPARITNSNLVDEILCIASVWFNLWKPKDWKNNGVTLSHGNNWAPRSELDWLRGDSSMCFHLARNSGADSQSMSSIWD